MSRTRRQVETNAPQEKVGSIIEMVRRGFDRIDSIKHERWNTLPQKSSFLFMETTPVALWFKAES